MTKGISDITLPIEVAVRSNTQVCRHSITGIAGSNPAEGMYVRLLCLLCVVQVATCVTSRSQVQSSSGWVFVRVRACTIVCDSETSKRSGLDPIWAVASQRKIAAIWFLFLGITREGNKLIHTRSQQTSREIPLNN